MFFEADFLEGRGAFEAWAAGLWWRRAMAAI
jgi:hypothetical protein